MIFPICLNGPYYYHTKLYEKIWTFAFFFFVFFFFCFSLSFARLKPHINFYGGKGCFFTYVSPFVPIN